MLLQQIEITWLKQQISTIWSMIVIYSPFSGFMETDTTVVFTHNLHWFDQRYPHYREHWSTSYMISNELFFSYQLSCLRYRYILTGSTSLVVSYLENFNDVYDDVPIKAHTTEGKREQVTISSVKLPLLGKFKVSIVKLDRSIQLRQ